MRLALPFLVLALPAFADCDTAQTQVEMTTCAGEAFKAADARLNLSYKAAMDSMKGFDADLDAQDQGAAKALRDAQRAWITFRDAECAAETFPYAGGSIEAMVKAECLARLSTARSEDLDVMAEGG